LQKFSVNIFTYFFYCLSRVRKGENSARTIAEIRINIFDAFTPRYRSYHTQEQITEWFHEEFFDKTLLTYPGDRYGFGMLGLKNESPS
jgi:hypothetical protein